MDSETEEVNSETVGMDNEFLPPDQKGYRLQNHPTISYNDRRENRRSMVCNNSIVGSCALHSVAKAYVNVFNAIYTFVEPNQPTNIFTKYTILTNYIIKQGLKDFGKKCKASVRK